MIDVQRANRSNDFRVVHTAECILRYADRELAAEPEAQHETTLREVIRELTTWLEAVRAGEHPRARECVATRDATRGGSPSTTPEVRP